MITLFRCDTICPIDQIKAQMASHIQQLPNKISSIGNSLKIMRLELVCEQMDILTWLHNQKVNTKIYWSNRNGNYEMGGVGIADGLKGDNTPNHKDIFEYMEDRLSADNPNLRYYGGMSFTNLSNPDEWEEFGAYQFLMPQFEFVHTDTQMTFAFNIAIDDINAKNIQSILTTLEQCDFTPETTYRKVPTILKRNDLPDKNTWDDLFTQTQKDSTDQKYEKIVLARKSVFDFDVALRPEALIKHLKDRTPNCFHFCFQLSPTTAFLGATPERLYKTNEKRVIHTEAIAGTRPRGVTEQDDQELEHQLLNSSKDTNEHQYVVTAITNSLEPLCATLKVEDTFCVRKLKGSQHLITSIEGKLDSKVQDYQILESLHPTPAVAGTPTQAAVHAIEHLEPFSRGWYTGPVGYVGFNHSEFAVAIRCGLIHEQKLSLYAGAGIVKDSDCDAEWNEIENKISNFMRVFEKKIEQK